MRNKSLIYNILMSLSMASLLCSCGKFVDKAVMPSLDSSKAKVTSIVYDAEKSTSTSAVFTIDGEAAKSAGATSYTLYLAPSDDLGSTTVGNGAKVQVVEMPDSSASCITVRMESLTEGSIWAPMARANYDNFVYSDWTYPTGKTGLKVGEGMIDLIFGSPDNFTLVPTSSTVDASWTPVPYAKTYTVRYKLKSSSEWIVIDGNQATAYRATGLEAESEYDFGVAAVKGDGTMSDYSTKSVKTLEKVDFDPNMKTNLHLQEFFLTRAEAAALSDKFTLENDIDMKGATIPSAVSFAGTLDGKGHSIKNATINASLFLDLIGTVRNLVIDSSCKITAGAQFGTIVLNNGGVLENCRNCADITVSAGTSSVVGGLVCMNKGQIKDCENAGKLTLEASNGAPVIGGIAAFTSESMSGNVNSGAITISLETSGKISKSAEPATTIGADVVPTIGGICGVSFFGTSKDKGFTKCDNNADVSLTYKKGDFQRSRVAGICGTSIAGTISECTNNGKVTVTYSLGSAQSTGSQLWAAGITNGNTYEFNKAGTYAYAVITTCTNTGEITLDTDCNSCGYNYLGGIVSTADIETTGAFDQPVSGCINNGKVVAAGYGKLRAGGIAAFAAHCEYCINNGEVTGGRNLTAETELGGIVGFQNGAGVHSIISCENYGTISAPDAVNEVRLGGMFGRNGGTTNGSNYSGNKSNCTIIGSNVCKTGILCGKISDTSVDLGTVALPNLVAGSIVKGGNTTVLTEANYSNLIVGETIGKNVKVVVSFLK